MNTSRFFDQLFNHSKSLAFILMNEDGIILDSNLMFTSTFGYERDEILGKYFKFLFTKEDQDIGKPEVELEICKTKGAARDENYVMHRNGSKIWTSGETIKVVSEDSIIYLAKIIHANHAKKVLEKYVAESNEFIEALFESVMDRGILIIDSRMKIVRCNTAFCSLFQLSDVAVENQRITDLHIPFMEALKEKIIRVFMGAEKANYQHDIQLQGVHGNTIHVSVQHKLMEFEAEKRLLMVFSAQA